MSPIDPLPPDQRAVLTLVLRQGRSYDEIASLLGLPVTAVRRRAHAGLAALAPTNGLPEEITAPLGDYLLGQQAARDAEATCGLLAESAPARRWTLGVAERLRPVAAGPLPEIPGAGEPEPAAGIPAHGDQADVLPEPGDSTGADDPVEPGRAGTGEPAVSRRGGALLIAGVLAAAVAVLVLALRDGNGAADGRSIPAAAVSATATPQARVTDEISLRGVGGAKARGRMTVFVEGRRMGFQIQAEDVPATGERTAYAVWLIGPGSRARRLGYTDPVGADGRLGIQGPGAADGAAFPELYATHEHVVVSRETAGDARVPTRPIMRGELPRGR